VAPPQKRLICHPVRAASGTTVGKVWLDTPTAATIIEEEKNRIEGVTGRTGSYAATNPWMEGNGRTDKTDCK